MIQTEPSSGIVEMGTRATAARVSCGWKSALASLYLSRQQFLHRLQLFL
jgi:hypothetical protein